MAARISFPENTTFRQQFTVLDTRTKAPISLVNSTIRFGVYHDASQYLLLSTSSGIAITDGHNGVCLLTFNPEDTVDGAGSYTWELEITEENGDVWAPQGGVMVITPRMLG